MEELGSRIWVAIRPFARDDDHADVLQQDCWQAILERLDQYGGRGSFAGWALALSRNVARMELRRAERAGRRETGLQDAEEVPDSAPNPEEEMVLLERRKTLYRALEKLPDRERDAIALWLFEEKDSAEIARAMGMGRRAARSLVARAVSRLRGMEVIQQLAMDWMV